MIDWKTPARSMADDDLGEAHLRIVTDIKRFQSLPADAVEHSGSPGEWMYERLDEIETEMTRRFMIDPRSSGVVGTGSKT